MIQQLIELGIPSVAKPRRRRFGRKAIATDVARKAAAEQTAVLVEAVDEAFASLPYPAQDNKQSDATSSGQEADLKCQTDSLADLLATQLKELDQQRGRLAQLLAQVDHRAPADKTATLG